MFDTQIIKLIDQKIITNNAEIQIYLQDIGKRLGSLEKRITDIETKLEKD